MPEFGTAEYYRAQYLRARRRADEADAKIAAAWEVIKSNRDTKLGDWVDLKEICEALGLNPRQR